LWWRAAASSSDSFPEEAFAGADNDGVDLQVQGVDEVVLDQRLGELRAAMNSYVAVASRLELLDLGDGRTEMQFEQLGLMPPEEYEGAGSGWSTFFDRIDERLAG
jgi:hypothetical protein